VWPSRRSTRWIRSAQTRRRTSASSASVPPQPLCSLGLRRDAAGAPLAKGCSWAWRHSAHGSSSSFTPSAADRFTPPGPGCCPGCRILSAGALGFTPRRKLSCARLHDGHPFSAARVVAAKDPEENAIGEDYDSDDAACERHSHPYRRGKQHRTPTMVVPEPVDERRLRFADRVARSRLWTRTSGLSGSRGHARTATPDPDQGSVGSVNRVGIRKRYGLDVGEDLIVLGVLGEANGVGDMRRVPEVCPRVRDSCAKVGIARAVRSSC
jgi:hypothetical protein